MRNIFALAIIVALAACTGCSTTGQQTPAQVAAKVCPATQGAITSLAAINGLQPQIQADVAKIAPIVNAACAASATVTSDSLAALGTTAIPAIITLVNASTLDAAGKNTAIADLAVAQLALNIFIAAQPAPGAPVAPQQVK